MVRYVVGFCFSRDCNFVLLVVKERPEWQRGKRNGLGGHVEEGETPLEAMDREFGEETEGRLGKLAWRPFARLRGEGFELWCFCCQADYAALCRVEGLVVGGERLVLSLVDADADPRPEVPNVRYLLPMARNHVLGLDRAEFFEVSEVGVSEECRRRDGGEGGERC